MTLPDRDYLLAPTADPSPLVFPLTHDELEQNTALVLTRAVTGAGHYCTAKGWLGNGVDSRLMNSALPAWLAASGTAVSLAATITPGPRRSARDYYVGLTNSGDSAKIELSAVADSADASLTQMALRYGSAIQLLNRSGWRFAFRLPELFGSVVPYNQALVFLDSNTLLVACHFNDQLTALYRCDLSTGLWTGKATSTTVYPHIGSLAVDSSGQVWATDNHGDNIPVDLVASFPSDGSAGVITAAARGLWSTPDVLSNGGITFVTVDGVEYVAKMAFSTGSDGHDTNLYVWRADQMGAPAYAADRVKRFPLGTYCQDITWRASDGYLYVSRGTGRGTVQVYDITTAIRSLADGTTLTALATYDAPTMWTEGVAFHPTTDELWMSVEGLSAPGDARQFSGSIWISKLDGQPAENRYLVDFLPTGEYQIRINERLFHQFTPSAPAAPNRLAIGGPPNVSPSWRGGYMFGGTIRNVALKDRPFAQSELDAINAGGSGTLTSTPVPILNPGAESILSGSPPPVANWTEEVSGTVSWSRASNPLPASGAYYFAATGASQQLTQIQDLLTILGLAGSALDTLTAAGKVTVMLGWSQASWDGTTDPGGFGIIALDASNAVLATIKSTEVWTDNQLWAPRTFSAQLPSGTRKVKLLQHATRTAGTNLDCYRDDLSAAVVVAS